MARKKKVEQEELVKDNGVVVEFENIPHKLNVMGQMMNDAIGAIHATHIVEHGNKDEDPYLKGYKKIEEDEMNIKINSSAQNLILKILNEYTFMLDNPKLLYE